MATVAINSSDRSISSAQVFVNTSWRTINIAYLFTDTFGWKVVFPSKPGTPTNVVATAIYDPNNGSRISLSWSAPSWSGGGPLGINDYEIWESTDGVNFYFKTFQGNTTTSRNISIGINACTTYYYKVAAINSWGRGDFSTSSAGALAFGPPSAPNNVFAIAGDGQITLYWSPPSNNGCSPITSYQVQRNTSSSAILTQTSWTAVNNSAGNNTHVFGGLSNGTTYYIRVRALNATYTNDGINNDGEISPVISATPQVLPGLVPSLSATRTSAGYNVSHSNYNSLWSYSGSVTSPGSIVGNVASSFFSVNIPFLYLGNRPTLSVNRSTRIISCSWPSTWNPTPSCTVTVTSSRVGYSNASSSVTSSPNRSTSYSVQLQRSTDGGASWVDWTNAGKFGTTTSTSFTFTAYSSNLNTQLVRCRVTINTGSYTESRFSQNNITIP